MASAWYAVGEEPLTLGFGPVVTRRPDCVAVGAVAGDADCGRGDWRGNLDVAAPAPTTLGAVSSRGGAGIRSVVQNGENHAGMKEDADRKADDRRLRQL